jgi:hypothetical protein
MAERFGKGNVDRIGGLWVLHLGGTSFERGLQHGTLMRYRVRDTIEFYRKLPSTLAARVAGESTYRLRALERLKRTLVRQLAKNRDSDALEEMRGLAVGLGMRVEELAEVMVLADVTQSLGALAERRRRAGPPALPGFGCTSAVRAAPNGAMLFGRDFDFWGAGYWDANPAVIFHHPDKGKAFCSIATGGFATGGITAINEDGLAVAVHQHGSRDSTLKGTPIIDIAHNIVRTCSSVDQAIEEAARHRATGGWSLVMAGGQPQTAAVLEMSSERQEPRFLSEQALVASNYFKDPELASRELQSNVSATLSDHARFDRALHLVDHSKMTPAKMAALLGDHFDPMAGRERSAGYTISRITNLSSVVFSLHDKKFWVSEAGAPTSKGGYVGFDLDAELSGRRSSVGRIEGGKAPSLKVTSAQDKYLEAYKEYIDSGDLNRVLMILSDCSSLDPREPTFPFVEGIVRSMVGNMRGALTSIDRSLEVEAVEHKRQVSLLWKARVFDMMDHRDRSTRIYDELFDNPSVPSIVKKAAKSGRKRPFREKALTSLMIDFTNGDTIE